MEKRSVSQYDFLSMLDTLFFVLNTRAIKSPFTYNKKARGDKNIWPRRQKRKPTGIILIFIKTENHDNRNTEFKENIWHKNRCRH